MGWNPPAPAFHNWGFVGCLPFWMMQNIILPDAARYIAVSELIGI